MRWLVTGPVHPDSFADNLVATLRSLGHEVAAMPSAPSPLRDGPLRRTFAELLSRAGLETASHAERWAVRTAREWKPNVVIAPTCHFGEESLRDLRRAGVKFRIAWWGDPPANLKRFGLASPEWDLILFKDEAAARKYRLLGLNAHHLHEAMNPQWHRPVASACNVDIAVAGNLYGFRQSLIGALLRRGERVGIYGPRPPRWCLPEIEAGHSGRYIVREAKSRVFGEALVCLNSFSPAEGNSLNCRAFEIAGAAGLQLIEDRPAIEECFDPGKEVLPFTTMDQLLDHVARARREPRWAEGIRTAGARRALAEHTYGHRIDAISRLAGIV